MNVTNFGWSVSSASGSGIHGAVLHVYKQRGMTVVDGYQCSRTQNGELDGKLFPSTDAAHAAAAERGYTTKAYRRPMSFIQLRLSPATRRFLKPLSREERVRHLKRLCAGSTCDMTADVTTRLCMRQRLEKWMSYLDGNNPEQLT